jgi:hypothetical protein
MMTNEALSSALRDLGSKDHLCVVHETGDDYLGAAAAYLKVGLERGERCLYIEDEPRFRFGITALEYRLRIWLRSSSLFFLQRKIAVTVWGSGWCRILWLAREDR